MRHGLRRLRVGDHLRAPARSAPGRAPIAAPSVCGSMMLAASMPNQAPTSWLRPIWPSRLAFLSFCGVGCSVFSPAHLTPRASLDDGADRLVDHRLRRRPGSDGDRRARPASVSRKILAGKPSWNALSAGATRLSRPNATSVRNSTAISGPAICRPTGTSRPMPLSSSRLKRAQAEGQVERQRAERLQEAAQDQQMPLAGEQDGDRDQVVEPAEHRALVERQRVVRDRQREAAEQVEHVAGRLQRREQHQRR